MGVERAFVKHVLICLRNETQISQVEHRAMRENTFGNPFKKDKKALAVDEVGVY